MHMWHNIPCIGVCLMGKCGFAARGVLGTRSVLFVFFFRLAPTYINKYQSRPSPRGLVPRKDWLAGWQISGPSLAAKPRSWPTCEPGSDMRTDGRLDGHGHACIRVCSGCQPTASLGMYAMAAMQPVCACGEDRRRYRWLFRQPTLPLVVQYRQPL